MTTAPGLPGAESTFAELLRGFRHSAGLSQEELAARSGLSVDAVAALERGRRRIPRPLTIRLLAEALGLDDLARSNLASASRPRGGAAAAVVPLPRAAGELIGRSAELARAEHMLTVSQTALLTLTGAAGVGKTRLALALAHRLESRFQGAAWASLAPLTGPIPIAAAIAAALGQRNASAVEGVEPIAEYIDRRSMLLVLDNAEHVLPIVAPACARLLERCPGLRIVVTSRELLRVPSEVVLVVSPFPVPPEGSTPAELGRSDAVRLFLARAESRAIAVDESELPAVGDICRRLDGVPLALELAAARLNVLSVEQLRAELEHSFRILSDASPTAPARHQTLDRAVEWSHTLLSADEQRLFAQLSVFSGGWTRTAAESVCRDEHREGVDILDGLGRLADKSLLLVRRRRGEARYDMLAEIAECARRKRGLRRDLGDLERRHADFHLALVEEADGFLPDVRQPEWFDRIEVEFDNIRAAMAWAIRTRNVGPALRFAGAMWTYFYLRGRYADGEAWVKAALQVRDGPVADADRRAEARALLGAGMLTFLQCRYDEAGARIEESLKVFRALGDRSGVALALRRLGSIARERADYDRARSLHDESLRIYVDLGDESGTAWAYNHLSFVAWLRGDLPAAAEHARIALATFRNLGDAEGLAWALINSGAVSMYRGDIAAGEARLSESLALSRRVGYREGVAWSLAELGRAAWQRGDVDRAVSSYEEALALHHQLGDRWRTSSVLEQLAAVASERGQPGYAAFLLGVAVSLREAIGTPTPPCEQAELGRTVARVRAELGPEVYASRTADGTAASLDTVVEGPAPV